MPFFEPPGLFTRDGGEPTEAEQRREQQIGLRSPRPPRASHEIVRKTVLTTAAAVASSVAFGCSLSTGGADSTRILLSDPVAVATSTPSLQPPRLEEILFARVTRTDSALAIAAALQEATAAVGLPPCNDGDGLLAWDRGSSGVYAHLPEDDASDWCWWEWRLDVRSSAVPFVTVCYHAAERHTQGMRWV